MEHLKKLYLRKEYLEKELQKVKEELSNYSNLQTRLLNNNEIIKYNNKDCKIICSYISDSYEIFYYIQPLDKLDQLIFVSEFNLI